MRTERGPRVTLMAVPESSSSEGRDDTAPPGGPVSVSRPSQVPSGDPTRDLSGTLHEVSNALTVVIGWIERARDEAGPGPGVAIPPGLSRALEVAAARAGHARSLVRRAIQPDATSGAFAEPSAHVGSLVLDALTGLEPELGRAGLSAERRIDAKLGERGVDMAVTVLQILTNLLLNAIAMSPRGARVTVEAKAGVPGTVVFAVLDEGPGVPPDRRANLFRAGVTTRVGGAGIGLRHAAALARANGGSLALVDSAHDARGARFELVWPLRSSPTTPLPPPPESRTEVHTERPSSIMRAMPLAGTRILIVEDDDAVVDLLDTALTARGADVVSVRHRRDLAGALATGPFDAALFDISPIQEDVKGAVALARDSGGHETPVRVVLISGSAAQMPDMPHDWVSAWVRKPFEVSEILEAIAPLSAKLFR